MSEPTPTPDIAFHFRIIQHKDAKWEDGQKIGVDCTGQDVRPADWRTLGAFIGDGQDSLKEAELIRMIPVYERKAYKTPPEKTSRARKLWLRDSPELTDEDEDKPTSPYQKYNWQPVSISIEPNKKKKHEAWKTKKKILDIEETEIESCILWDPDVDDDVQKEFTSYCLRSGNPIFGRNYAPPISFEMRGFTEALGLCSFPSDDSTPRTESIKWILNQHGERSPDFAIDAVKHTIRGKLKYSVRMQGTIAGDCSVKNARTSLYRQFPVDFVFEYNGINPTTEMYEDIELVYYTNIAPRYDS